MRTWIVVGLSVLVLATSAVETLQTAFDPELGACADDDDDRCPPFSDDCGDCGQCVHWNALPPVVAVVLPVRSPVASDGAPAIGCGRMPSDAPPDEILTVPRA